MLSTVARDIRTRPDLRKAVGVAKRVEGRENLGAKGKCFSKLRREAPKGEVTGARPENDGAMPRW